MSEPVWYYAQGDEEKGPITTAQIKALARVGRLKADDLVWKEGMDDWKPASEIRGLILVKNAPAPVPADAPPQFDGAPADVQPVADPPKFQGTEELPPSPVSKPMATDGGEGNSMAGAPSGAVGAVGVGTGALAASTGTPAAGAGTPAGGTGTPAAAKSRPRFALPTDSTVLTRQLGRTLALLGLLLVVSSRGCDSLGERKVVRLRAIAAVAKSDPEETTAAREEKGKVASQASLHDAMSAFWRQTMFIFGTLLLVPGLAMVGTTTDGAERWASFVVLIIIVFSLYVMGEAWASSPPVNHPAPNAITNSQTI